MRIRKLAIAFGLMLFFTVPTTSSAADLWYEDNNLGQAQGAPADFLTKFKYQDSFAKATKYLDVYMIRANVLFDIDDQAIRSAILPYFVNNDLQFAIDAGGATWGTRKGRMVLADKEIDLLKRLKEIGLKVDYVSLQSVLSKPLRLRGQLVEYPMALRIEAVVSFAQRVKGVFPQAQIGIIDALPSHGKEYRQPYRLLAEAMDKAGLKLSYVHLDMPFGIPKEKQHGVDWNRVLEVERFVEEDLELDFGYFATSAAGGRRSSRAFHEDVLADLDCYAASGGTPDDYIIASWFSHPQKTIPETVSGDEYPAMWTVLEFGRKLEWIEAADPEWRASRRQSRDWRQQCGIGVSAN